MRAFVRSSLLAALLATSGAAFAGDGVFLPTAPQGPGGEDSIETADGTRCRQSINSNGSYLDLGIAGQASSPLPQSRSDSNLFVYQQDRDREALVYARVTIPLGRKPTRLDCSRLYELEIVRLQREIELLRMAAE